MDGFSTVDSATALRPQGTSLAGDRFLVVFLHRLPLLVNFSQIAHGSGHKHHSVRIRTELRHLVMPALVDQAQRVFPQLLGASSLSPHIQVPHWGECDML